MGKTVLPNPRVSPRFGGICTFCRYPRLEDVAPENRPIDWAIYGVPYDTGVTYRPGARFGPRAIREASQYVKRFHTGYGVDVCEVLSICDAGDASVKPYDLKETLDGVAEWACDVSDSCGSDASGVAGGSDGAKLFAVGGDHSIAYSNIRATFERCGKPRGGLRLVHFDAHLDTVDEVWGEKWGHASPFRRVIEEGLIDAKNSVSIGMRGPLNSGADLDFVKQAGLRIITPEEIRSMSAMNLASTFSMMVREDAPTYFTFDVDCLDPAFAPGTGTPCPGGFSSSEALAIIRAMQGIRIDGADVVEVLPDRDVAGITSFFAAHVIFEFLALDAVRRKGGKS